MEINITSALVSESYHTIFFPPLSSENTCHFPWNLSGQDLGMSSISTVSTTHLPRVAMSLRPIFTWPPPITVP